jgi:inorganic triphosphatase YgiF
MSDEIELKFLIASDEVRRFQRHPWIKALTRQKLPSQRLLSIYYDTPDCALHKQRIALRLRRVGRRWIQTVKTEGRVSAGLHERPEWECETTKDTFAFAAIPDPTIREFFADERLQRTLQPVFVTEFTRARRMLELASGDVVECSLDRGKIRAGEDCLPICEVELELKSGEPIHLFEFALSLQETLPLKLENVSKAERGYRLVAHTAPIPVKAKTPALAKSLSVREVFIRIFQSCMIHLQANEEGVLREDDPEFVHQMRVALRRARSALRVFSSVLSSDNAEKIRAELRWLAGALNGARNWDVFVLTTLPPILAAFPGHQGLAWLHRHGATIRQHSNAQAREAVLSPRYQRFLLTLGAWLCSFTESGTNPNETAESTDTDLTAFATAILQKRYRQLKKRGKSLSTLSPVERHAVRIAAKKLRYSAEFFSSLYSGKRTSKYLGALATVQDVLGMLNDATTAETLLQEITTTEDMAVHQHPEGIVLGWLQSASHVRLVELARTWDAFLERKPFWR